MTVQIAFTDVSDVEYQVVPNCRRSVGRTRITAVVDNSGVLEFLTMLTQPPSAKLSDQVSHCRGGARETVRRDPGRKCAAAQCHFGPSSCS